MQLGFWLVGLCFLFLQKAITIKMKTTLLRLSVFLLLVLGSVSLSAQYYMNIRQTDGSKRRYSLSAIDSVWFDTYNDIQLLTLPATYLNSDSIILSGQILNPENVVSDFQCGVAIYQKVDDDTILIAARQSFNYKDGIFSVNGIIYEGGIYYYRAIYVDNDTAIFGNLVPYEVIDQLSIKVSFHNMRMDLFWGLDWEEELQYSWNDDSDGPIGYTAPELIKGTVYNVDTSTGKRISSFVKVFNPNGGGVSLTAGSTYDLLFYNFGTEWISFSQSDDYESYTASTRSNSYYEGNDESVYIASYNQPDELFGTLVSGVNVTGNPSDYEKEYDDNGNVYYYKNIDVSLKPYSFIYLYQIVILNNADNEGNRITGARGITVTGLSDGVDLFTRKTIDNGMSISTDDIKPLQNHENVRLADGSTVDNADIMATRILTWGLPGINPLQNVRAGTRAGIKENYIGMGLSLRSGKTYSITQDITSQMHEKPLGGIITIYVDANDIPGELLQP